MDIPDPVPFGRVAPSDGDLAVLKLDAGRELGDGERVRLQGANGKPVECYVKSKGAGEYALYADHSFSQPILIGRVAAGFGAVRLAAEDWAIVVGINYYIHKGLRPLQGPQRDAELFAKWVKESACVPDDQVIRVPSCIKGPATEDEAVPTLDSVTKVLAELLAAAMGKPTMRLGRRLYFFFSGHGIAPTRAENPDFREAALLMANATDVLLTRHIGTRTHAEYFRGRGIFDEVIMFVDCCRDLKNNVFLTPTQLPAVSSQRPPGRYFYAASTQLGSKAWERSFGGQVRGIFSKVLIDGLNDPKLCDDQRYLTGSDLAKWLYTRIPAETDKQDPEIDRYTGPQDIILFKRPPEGPPEARISFSPAYVGKTARLYQGNDTRNAVGEAEIELDWIWQVSVRVDWLYKVAVEGTPAAALFQAEEAITNVWVP